MKNIYPLLVTGHSKYETASISRTDQSENLLKFGRENIIQSNNNPQLIKYFQPFSITPPQFSYMYVHYTRKLIYNHTAHTYKRFKIFLK